MLALTRKTDYALVALSELARSFPATLSARQLAEVTGISFPVLSGVLNHLVRGELVVSIRGVQGGYRLARSAEEIRLVDIVEAIDGPPRLTQCCSQASPALDADETCDLEGSCRIMGPMQRVHRCFTEFMSRIPLSHIAFDFVPVQVAINGDRGMVKNMGSDDAALGGARLKSE